MLGNVPDDNGEAGKRRGSTVRTGVTAAAVAGVAVVLAIVLIGVSSGKSERSAAAEKDGSGAGSGPAAPLRVLAVTPAAKTRQVTGDADVQVVFSAPLAAGTPTPAISPDVPGTWSASGQTLTFDPAIPFAPSTNFTIKIPAGQAGVRSATGGVLARSQASTFKTASYSPLRLAELLTQLGYLPMSWAPSAGGRMTGEPSGGGLAGQEALAYSPPLGSFAWSGGYPASLRAQWQANRPNLLVKGAVMAFQSQHQMAVNGQASSKLWHKLFLAAAAAKRNPVGYTYAIASKGSPEKLTIWHDGHVVLRSLANTGIPVAPTASGTFPVYLRFRNQIMSGTNPDGSHYADPVSFVSYFDGGEAVHYFPRGSYGFPQSLGCVELPYNDAERAWPYLTYGSLVTVSG